jgi:branched-chain amino acid transport system ATP-binding protein
MAALLEVSGLDVRYGSAQVLFGIDLEVRPGEMVGLLGANGAGKSTLLKAISGLVRPAAGRVVFEGRDLAGRPPHQVLAAGISQAAEGRRIFRSQTVQANLLLGAYGRGVKGAELDAELERIYDLFPVLRQKLADSASLLSGGEQQMLAVAQAMLARPRLLLLDEPSLGLAPIAIWNLVDRLKELNEAGLSLLLVEQQVAVAEAICDRLYFLRNGRMVISGVPPSELDAEAVRTAYV